MQGAEVADADHGLVENAFEGSCGTGGGSGGGQRLVDVAPLGALAAFPEAAKRCITIWSPILYELYGTHVGNPC